MKPPAFFLMTLILCTMCLHSFKSNFSSLTRVGPERVTEIGLSAAAMNCLVDLGGNKEEWRRCLQDADRHQAIPPGGFTSSICYHLLLSLERGPAVGTINSAVSLLQGQATPPPAATVDFFSSNLPRHNFRYAPNGIPSTFFFPNTSLRLFSLNTAYHWHPLVQPASAFYWQLDRPAPAPSELLDGQTIGLTYHRRLPGELILHIPTSPPSPGIYLQPKWIWNITYRQKQGYERI